MQNVCMNCVTNMYWPRFLIVDTRISYYRGSCKRGVLISEKLQLFKVRLVAKTLLNMKVTRNLTRVDLITWLSQVGIAQAIAV